MNPRRLEKSLAAIIAIGLLAAQAQATDISLPKCHYGPQEVLWFSTVHSNVVAVFGNGVVAVWDFLSGELRAQSSMSPDDLVYPGNTLALSHGQRTTVAAITPRERWVGDRFFAAIALCDVFEAAKRTDAWVELVRPANSGFVGRGSTLVLADTPPNNAAVLESDTTTGKTLWRSEADDDVQTGTILAADGQCYVNFCRDRTLRARDHSGKLLWDWHLSGTRFAEPGFWPDNPSLPYVVVHESDLKRSDSVGDLIALSAQSGRTLWRKRRAQFGCLKAVSDDGKRQAFFSRAHLEIAALPKRGSVRVAALQDDLDARFASDGRFLLCLPALETVSENKAANSYEVARKSKLLSVVNAETGKITKQFPLLPSERH
jgi:outer membrane protein assembly factor BamB